MQPNENIQSSDDGGKLEVVVGVFSSHQDASRVAASLRGPDMKIQKVSRKDPGAPDDMPSIVYEEIEEVDSGNLTSGALMGGAIGAGSGLLLIGIPAVGPALAAGASLAGLLAGAWIGAVAGVDETIRGIELPNSDEYQKLLAAGKSFVVIAGDEAERIEVGKKMVELGAEDAFQHPPVQQLLRP